MSPALAAGFFTTSVTWLRQFMESVQSLQSLSRAQLFVTVWIAVCQAFPSITNSRSLLKLMSIESVMPINHVNLCRPLLLLPFPASGSFQKSQFPISGGQSIGASASILPRNIQDWFPLGLPSLIFFYGLCNNHDYFLRKACYKFLGVFSKTSVLKLYITWRIWVSELVSWYGPENVHFSQVPGWCWCCLPGNFRSNHDGLKLWTKR